jgi:chemotaxis protein MotB
MFFANGSPEPTKEGSSVLVAITGVISKLPNRVIVEGHTDSVPFSGGGEYGNWELSSARANAARIVMAHGGLRENQLAEIRGFADQQLRLPKQPDDPSNRRISIIILNMPQKAQPKTIPEVPVVKKKRFILF